ncbi:MAG: hypothetical protein EWM72_00124 [Nitrospira sp.]|nr:MAG: hypothetical protein EWM72_00124 [Nitrospira sp.]
MGAYLVKRPSTWLGLRRAQSSRTVSLPLDSARGLEPVERSNREAYLACREKELFANDEIRTTSDKR